MTEEFKADDKISVAKYNTLNERFNGKVVYVFNSCRWGKRILIEPEISEINGKFVICTHAEVRHINHDTDEQINEAVLIIEAIQGACIEDQADIVMKALAKARQGDLNDRHR